MTTVSEIAPDVFRWEEKGTIREDFVGRTSGLETEFEALKSRVEIEQVAAVGAEREKTGRARTAPDLSA